MLILALVLPQWASSASRASCSRPALGAGKPPSTWLKNILRIGPGELSRHPHRAGMGVGPEAIPVEVAPLLLPGGTLSVKVTPGKGEQVRQVTVTIAWQTAAIGPPQQMQLTTLLAPRTTIGASP